MLVEIDGLYFNVPSDWSDITLKDFLSINELVESAPKEDASEKEMLSFQIDYISRGPITY